MVHKTPFLVLACVLLASMVSAAQLKEKTPGPEGSLWLKPCDQSCAKDRSCNCSDPRNYKPYGDMYTASVCGNNGILYPSTCHAGMDTCRDKSLGWVSDKFRYQFVDKEGPRCIWALTRNELNQSAPEGPWMELEKNFNFVTTRKTRKPRIN